MQQSEASVAANLPFVTWEIDTAGRFLALSPAWSGLTRVPVRESIGRPLLDFIHPSDQDKVHGWIDYLLSGQSTNAKLQARFCIKEGAPIWGEFYAQIITDPSGAILKITGALVDISDRKQLESALTISESRFQAIFEGSALGILILRLDEQTMSANPAALRLLGRSELELKARPLSELISEEGQTQWNSAFAEILDAQQEVQRLEVSFIRSDSASIEVDVHINAVRDESGQLLSAAVLLKDITEAKRVERDLIQSKQKAEEIARFKSALLNNVSHELRTPLATILGFSAILVEEVSDGQREFIQMIKQAGERLMDTLNSMMDLAQLEAGELDIRLEALHVQDEVQDVAIRMMPQARDKSLAFTMDLPEKPLFINGDRSFLHRILKHLISNAVKFTGEGGISLSVEANKKTIAIHVKDTGAGISPSFLTSLFEEFQQESTGMSRTYEGAGIGLSVTKRLVERMGGRIAVESRKGAGSTFSLTFPRTHTDA